jgi:DNA ligase-1
MDIRGFFGGPKAAVSKPKIVSVPLASVKCERKENESNQSDVITPSTEPDIESNEVLGEAPISDSASSPPKAENHQVELSELPDDLKSFIFWEKGEKIPYRALTETFDKISSLSGRLEKEAAFAKLFMAVVVTTPDNLEDVFYLCSNSVAPAYAGIELGIGDAVLVKAVVESTGRSKQAVDLDYKNQGDLGDVALESKNSQKTLSFAAKAKPLVVVDVLKQFRAIANVKGGGSQAQKVSIIKNLMVKAVGSEPRYIIRALQGKLRLGAAAQSALVALAHSFAIRPVPGVSQSGESKADETEGPEKPTDIVAEIEGILEAQDSQSFSETLPLILDVARSLEPAEAIKLREGVTSKTQKKELAEIVVKRAYSECPNFGKLCPSLLSMPLHEIHRTCKLQPGVPVAPMLAKPTKQIGEVLKRLSGLEFTMEYKYDGERAQVHLLEDGSVKIFSRNSEDNTGKYPDLIDIIKSAKRGNIKSCVVDAEVVAFDREKNVLLPFQVLSTRKRKVDDGDEDTQKVKVVLQAFDLLYINGVSLLPVALKHRRRILHESFVENIGRFTFASGIDHLENGDTAPIETFMHEACGAMCEGLMVKTLTSNATYEPSKRSLNWLKLKKDYIEGMGICDSVDLVVIGAYHGKGKRTNVFGAYLMACYDPDADEFQSVCKVGTGFKDEVSSLLCNLLGNPYLPFRTTHPHSVGTRSLH